MQSFKEIHYLSEEKNRISKKYGDYSVAEGIREDIKKISPVGLEVAEATNKFFEVAKNNMAKIEVARVRGKAVKGLQELSNKIDIALAQKSDSLEKNTALVVEAIRAFEEASKAR